MKFFYLSSEANPNGHFEIHDKECDFIPDSINRDYLGPFNNGQEALRKAKQLKSTAICCENCCKTTFKAVFNTGCSNSE